MMGSRTTFRVDTGFYIGTIYIYILWNYRPWMGSISFDLSRNIDYGVYEDGLKIVWKRVAAACNARNTETAGVSAWYGLLAAWIIGFSGLEGKRGEALCFRDLEGKGGGRDLEIVSLGLLLWLQSGCACQQDSGSFHLLSYWSCKRLAGSGPVLLRCRSRWKDPEESASHQSSASRLQESLQWMTRKLSFQMHQCQRKVCILESRSKMASQYVLLPTKQTEGEEVVSTVRRSSAPGT